MAAANRSAFAEGRDPLADKQKASMPTFREAARIVYQAYIPRCRSETAESLLPTLLCPLRIPNASESLATFRGLLKARMDEAKQQHPGIQGKGVAKMTFSVSPRKPTFLQRERWKVVQLTKQKGLSTRGMSRELGIH